MLWVHWMGSTSPFACHPSLEACIITTKASFPWSSLAWLTQITSLCRWTKDPWDIYNGSELKVCFKDGTINLPPPRPITNNNRPSPYFMLADDVFPIRTYLMKPYMRCDMTDAELITNYRILRGRMVAENAFGILASRWQALLTTLQQNPEVATVVVEVALCLHNLMRMRYPGLQNA